MPTAVSPYLWHPTPTAMALATLDEMAPGRVAVALGVGNPLFLQESGQKLEKPVRVMREYIAAMRKLWTTEPTHMDGEFVKLAGARLAFKPNPIPIYIAAMGPDMLQADRPHRRRHRALGRPVDRFGASARSRCARKAPPRRARDLAALRRAGYIFFGTSSNAREAIDAVRGKLAFVMRNKFLAQNIKDSGIPVDQEAVIAAIAKRDLEGAAALVPDEAVEAFGIAGRPSTACAGCAISSTPGSRSRC